jgi:hypothetical protein
MPQRSRWRCESAHDPPATAGSGLVIRREPLPEVTLDTGDATELSDVLHFLPSWLARDPGRLRSSLEGVAGNPVTGLRSRVRTSSASCSRSAETTGNLSSARALPREAREFGIC